MGTATIPVDLLNPGQVFACLGFLEAAEVLAGPATGGFTWDHPNDPDARFTLTITGSAQPVETVLEFLAAAEVTPLVPATRVPDKAPGVIYLGQDSIEEADSY